jgi:hypothetical protein
MSATFAGSSGYHASQRAYSLIYLGTPQQDGGGRHILRLFWIDLRLMRQYIARVLTQRRQ